MAASILVVDDEPSILEAFELMLGGSFALRMAGSAEEALATPLGEAAFVRVIFLDGLLGPGMSGDQALPQLKRRFPLARIVYIGAGGSSKAAELKAAGVSVVLPKPWKVEEVQAAARLGMDAGGAER